MSLYLNYIIEKFYQNSDPIKDLGIGIITFENIDLGDIIVCTKHSELFTFNDDVEFPVSGVYALYSKKIHKNKKIELGFIPYDFLANLHKKDVNYIRVICKTQNIPRFWIVHTNIATLEEWEEHFRILQRNELKTYGVYESLNEEFKEESDPISDMNIGVKSKILADLKTLGVSEKDIIIKDDGTIKHKGYYKPYEKRFIEIQLKYMPKEKSEFVKEIIDISQNLKLTKAREELLEDSISKALKNNISKEDIKDLVKEFGGDVLNPQTDLLLQKLTRSKKQIAYDKKYNIYVFIGFTEKVPVIIQGKKYYEDRLGTESIVKIDKFNVGQLKSVGMMRLRAKVQYGSQDGQVYMIELPKEVLDGDRYESIPDYLYDIFDKYKRRV